MTLARRRSGPDASPDTNLPHSRASRAGQTRLAPPGGRAGPIAAQMPRVRASDPGVTVARARGRAAGARPTVDAHTSAEANGRGCAARTSQRRTRLCRSTLSLTFVLMAVAEALAQRRPRRRVRARSAASRSAPQAMRPGTVPSRHAGRIAALRLPRARDFATTRMGASTTQMRLARRCCQSRGARSRCVLPMCVAVDANAIVKVGTVECAKQRPRAAGATGTTTVVGEHARLAPCARREAAESRRRNRLACQQAAVAQPSWAIARSQQFEARVFDHASTSRRRPSRAATPAVAQQNVHARCAATAARRSDRRRRRPRAQVGVLLDALERALPPAGDARPRFTRGRHARRRARAAGLRRGEPWLRGARRRALVTMARAGALLPQQAAARGARVCHRRLLTRPQTSPRARTSMRGAAAARARSRRRPRRCRCGWRRPSRAPLHRAAARRTRGTRWSRASLSTRRQTAAHDCVGARRGARPGGLRETQPRAVATTTTAACELHGRPVTDDRVARRPLRLRGARVARVRRELQPGAAVDGALRVPLPRTLWRGTSPTIISRRHLPWAPQARRPATCTLARRRTPMPRHPRFHLPAATRTRAVETQLAAPMKRRGDGSESGQRRRRHRRAASASRWRDPRRRRRSRRSKAPPNAAVARPSQRRRPTNVHADARLRARSETFRRLPRHPPSATERRRRDALDPHGRRPSRVRRAAADARRAAARRARARGGGGIPGSGRSGTGAAGRRRRAINCGLAAAASATARRLATAAAAAAATRRAAAQAVRGGLRGARRVQLRARAVRLPAAHRGRGVREAGGAEVRVAVGPRAADCAVPGARARERGLARLPGDVRVPLRLPPPQPAARVRLELRQRVGHADPAAQPRVDQERSGRAAAAARRARGGLAVRRRLGRRPVGAAGVHAGREGVQGAPRAMRRRSSAEAQPGARGASEARRRKVGARRAVLGPWDYDGADAVAEWGTGAMGRARRRPRRALRVHPGVVRRQL